MSLEQQKATVAAFIDSHADTLIELSLKIHDASELGFQEVESARCLREYLAAQGMQVEAGTAEMPTAFVARSLGGQPRPVIAFLAEYDALPEVGHACGHNIIGTSAAAAGAALASLGAELPGAAWVVGTPAEENGGGKIVLTKAGTFEGVDAVLMNHPLSGDTRLGGTSLAIHSYHIRYQGKPAHAAGNPSAGVNALDAACIFLHAIALLRQHVTEDVRLHGFIVDGGKATNIIPETSEVRYLARAAKRATLDELAEKIRGCIQAGAVATGCKVEVKENKSYEPVKPNQVMNDVLSANLTALGVNVNTDPVNLRGSTDLGEVSQVVPQSCVYISIAPSSVAGHTHEFAAASASDVGHEAMLVSARAMAWAALDLMHNPELLERAWKEHRQPD